MECVDVALVAPGLLPAASSLRQKHAGGSCGPMEGSYRGGTFMTSSMETSGRGRQSGASQRKSAYTEPMSSCMKPIVTGNPVAPPAAFRASLLLRV